MKRFGVLLFVVFCVNFVYAEITNAEQENYVQEILDILKQNDVVTDEQYQDITQKIKAKEKKSKWTEKIKLYGDLRLRHDTQWKTDEDGDKDPRNRERFRFRLGMKAEINEATEIGLRLASGSGYQNTTNQSFDEHGRGKEIFIDRAYASWKPVDFFKIIGGKHKNPLFTSSLVWDSDVNPEGVSESFNFKLSNNIEIFANLGQWMIEEIKKTSDPALFTYQAGTSVKFSKNVKFKFAVSYYDFMNLDRFDNGDLGEDDTFVGYNHKYGQQMIFDDKGNLLNEFGCWEAQAKFTMKNILPAPISIFGSYILNTKADIKKLIKEGANGGDLEEYSGDDRDMGWLVGVSLGSKKKKGDWYLKYFYQELQDYAFPAVFVDSDFHGGGTNNKGHYVQGKYFFTDNIHAAATVFITEREDERKDDQLDENRVQLDMIFAF